MCLVGPAFGGKFLLIYNIGPTSFILANWTECCYRRLLTRPGPRLLFSSDEEVENHNDNRHYLNVCPQIFKEKAEVIKTMEVQSCKHIGISVKNFVKHIVNHH